MRSRSFMHVLILAAVMLFITSLQSSSYAAVRGAIKLATPENLKMSGTVLSWDAVENADESVHTRLSGVLSTTPHGAAQRK